MILEYWALGVLFFLGTSVGSFLNVFEMRLWSEDDIVKKPSHCPKCKQKLKALDLIPIFSFALLGGKCRYCETKVSWQYPIIEFLSGMLFFASGCYVSSRMQIDSFEAILFMLSISFIFGVVLSLFLFFGLYDMKHQIVPNKVVYPSLVVALIYNILIAVSMHLNPGWLLFAFYDDFSILWNIVAGLVGASFIAAIIILTKGKGMGGGDLKLLALMGLVLGWKRLIIAFYIAIITGSFIGLAYGLKKGKIRGQKIPFGTFLSFGTIVALLWGQMIWERVFGGVFIGF